MIDELHEWTDGAASQYKCVYAFADLVDCVKKYPGISIFRHYFETSHAKGPQDGAGGVLKHTIRYYCFWDHDNNCWHNKIVTAWAVFKFCLAEMRHSRSMARHGVQLKSTKMWERFFFWIGPAKEEGMVANEVKRPQIRQEYSSVNGTQKFHSVRQGVKPNTIWTRKITCVCRVCYGGEIGVCDNAKYIDPWKESTLKTSNVPAREELKSRLACFNANRSQVVTIGKVFCVFADDTDKEDFYLVHALSECKPLSEAVKDSYGNKFRKHTTLIKGAYFKVLGEETSLYELDLNKITYFYPENVLFPNVQMSVTDSKSRLRLENEDKHRIMNSLRFH
jgi:hypothetical protein